MKWIGIGTEAPSDSQRSEIAAEAAGLGIFEWDLQRGVAIAENARLHEILGQAIDAPLGPDGVRSRLHRDDLPLFDAAIAKALANGGAWQVRVRVWRDAEQLALADFFGRIHASGTVGAVLGTSVAIEAQAPAAPEPAAGKPFRGGLSAEQFRRVVDHMARHLGEDVTLAQLSSLAGFSPFHFQRAFKRQTGTTPQGYLLRLRVQHAKNLLFGTARPLADIAREAGYGTAQAFSRAFTRLESISPAEFRRRMRGG
jgi:AraC-like DNA-binding protein